MQLTIPPKKSWNYLRQTFIIRIGKFVMSSNDLEERAYSNEIVTEAYTMNNI